MLPQKAEIQPDKLIIACYLPTEQILHLNICQSLAKIVHVFAEEVTCPHLACIKACYADLGRTLASHSALKDHAWDNFELVPKSDSLHPSFYKIQGAQVETLQAYLNKLDKQHYEQVLVAIDDEMLKAALNAVEANLQAVSDNNSQGNIQGATGVF